jgi:hypothetical protein
MLTAAITRTELAAWLAQGLVGGLVVLLLTARWWRKAYLRRKKRREREAPRVRCDNCGYDLSGQDLPRCPECGALRGFRVPLSELGLTEEEVREGVERMKQMRAARDAGESSSDASPRT